MSDAINNDSIVMGRKRPTNNPLIIKNVVGKANINYDMPSFPPDHVFGDRIYRDSEGAGDVVLNWWNPHPEGNPKVNAMLARRKINVDRNKIFGDRGETPECMQFIIQNNYEKDWKDVQKAKAIQKSQLEEQRKQKKKAAISRVGGNSKRQETINRMRKAKENQWIAKRTAHEGKVHPVEYFTSKQFKAVPARYMLPVPLAVDKTYYDPPNVHDDKVADQNKAAVGKN